MKCLGAINQRRVAARDIVQFVQIRDFAHQPSDRLAASVLSNLSDNIVEYFSSRSSPSQLQQISRFRCLYKNIAKDLDRRLEEDRHSGVTDFESMKLSEYLAYETCTFSSFVDIASLWHR